MHSRGTMVLWVLAAGLSTAVGGCNQKDGDDEPEAKTTEAPARTTEAAPADTSTSESDGTTGIADCDKFLVKYRCMLRNNSQNQRAADQMAEAWRKEADTATGRATTANICRLKSRAMQPDFIRSGCEVAPRTTTTDTTTTTTTPTTRATSTQTTKPEVPGLG